jgi:hypothetical protein
VPLLPVLPRLQQRHGYVEALQRVFLPVGVHQARTVLVLILVTVLITVVVAKEWVGRLKDCGGRADGRVSLETLP